MELFEAAEVKLGVLPGTASEQEEFEVEEGTVKVTVKLLFVLEPRETAGLSLTSEKVKVSVPGLLEFTAKTAFPLESVAAVQFVVPRPLPLILNPESAVLIKVI